ncbi:hypothetical protein HOI26_01015 [Candidatus Woesearchaeota archaeon]|jgi:hypothetical protein|nr:hypothetical protein [Candidatus Woesearchaeota archaeon]MBT5739655.1 hypothetical protein [Candidatus Woesearchaeota archaeon]
MQRQRKVELRKKGWSVKELEHAEAALERSTSHDLFISKMVFWSALVVIIVANVLVAFTLIPFLIALNKGILFAIIIVLAGSIGFLYNFLITDIGLLEKKHHRIASVIVPLFGIGNVLAIVFISNKFIAGLPINNVQHNAWLLALIFGIAFILPYIIDQVRRSLKK